jgi:metal-responsive CopG/Arc/MetJ family transcriptional regulator
MKTIAITIDENLLARLDRLAGRSGHARTNRSRVIRDAVREYVARLERIAGEEREAEIIKRHRGRLARQARALVGQQSGSPASSRRYRRRDSAN